MASAGRNKDVRTVLTRLTKSFYQLMSADIRIDLFGKDIFTWSENEVIENAAKRSNKEGIGELLTALKRKGARGLDALVEALEEEEGANQEILEAIRAEWPKKPLPESAQPPPKGVFAEGRPLPLAISSETEKELLGDPTNPTWPFERQSDNSALSKPIPPPPEEGTDTWKKDVYKMTAKPRGTAIIINNKNFTCGMKDRVGTDIDADALSRLFVHLGFYTNRFDNLKGRDFRKRLQELADLNHSKADCLIVSILTHGVNGKFYSTDGDLISVEEVTSYFDGVHCSSLIGKPKVFIFQACRGGRFDYGVEMESTDAPGEEPVPEEEVKEMMETQFDKIVEKTLDEVTKSPLGDETDGGGYNKSALPTEADFIVAYATLPGYVSWRNSEYGSWFIKAFTDAMFELAGKEHLNDILIEVNRRVAEEFQSKGRNKQMPAPVSMLTRKLYFRPGSYK